MLFRLEWVTVLQVTQGLRNLSPPSSPLVAMDERGRSKVDSADNSG